METLAKITDFDLQIDEIILVHKNRFVENYCWNSYRTGRTMDGLVLCTSGQGRFIFPTETLILEKGQMLFLSAYNAYTVQCCGAEPFVHFTANFRLNRDMESIKTCPLLTTLLSGNLHKPTDIIQFPHHQDAFEALLSVWQNKSSGYRIMAKSILYNMIYQYLIEMERHMYHSDTYYKLIPAQELMDRKYTEEHSISQLAELCNLSETHFRRLFSRLYGCSPTEYRKRKRLLHAKDLLLTGEYTVSEIAQMIGFRSQNYFARFFKKEIGISPTEYIKQFYY